mmetsp:Transcript_114124/g.333605  ORF Transcript_114124/g.333605 Transcript_114124/m.333605 type:complete len:273 (+) Transcript_114124:181-999(+)
MSSSGVLETTVKQHFEGCVRGKLGTRLPTRQPAHVATHDLQRARHGLDLGNQVHGARRVQVRAVVRGALAEPLRAPPQGRSGGAHQRRVRRAVRDLRGRLRVGPLRREDGVDAEAGAAVDLEQPRPAVRAQHDVEAQDVEAAPPRPGVAVAERRGQGLHGGGGDAADLLAEAPDVVPEGLQEGQGRGRGALGARRAVPGVVQVVVAGAVLADAVVREVAGDLVGRPRRRLGVCLAADAGQALTAQKRAQWLQTQHEHVKTKVPLEPLEKQRP